MAERARPDIREFQLGSPWRQEFIRRYSEANVYAAGKRVLDCPCGVGWGSSLLVSAKHVLGIDISEEAIAFANTYYSSDRLKFMVEDMTTMDLREQFELAVFLEGIEHVHKNDGVRTLKNLSAHLAPHGEIFLSVPVREAGPQKNPYHLYSYLQEEILDILYTLYIPKLKYISSITDDVDVLYFIGTKK